MNQDATNVAGDRGREGHRQPEALLMEMGKALRAMSMYPAGHPQRANLLGQAYNGVAAVLSSHGDVSLQVTREAFIHNGDKLGASQPVMRELAREMHLRQVKSFSLRRELSREDFVAFLEMLLLDPEMFREGRFIEKWIQDRQMRTVWINEIDFSRLAGLSGAEEDEAEGEPAPDSRMAELLDMLDGEDDPEEFGRLLGEIESYLGPFIEKRQYEEVFRVLSVVSSHGTEELRPGPDNERIRRLAVRAVRAIAKGQTLAGILTLYADSYDRDRMPFSRVFEQAGPQVVDEAMNVISQKEAMSAYQPVLRLILSCGGHARQPVEAHLVESEPTRLRKALYILGELRHKESVDKIRPFIEHDDPRVKREAVRALTRIKTIEASRALTMALWKVPDNETRVMIVQSLGEGKNLAAVPALLKLLKKTPLRQDTAALLEAVIDALGRIGSKEALPHLIKQLNRFTLFKRDLVLRLRLKAAESLGRIGGERAVQSLARYAGEGRDPLSRTSTAVFTALLEHDGKPVERIEEYLK